MAPLRRTTAALGRPFFCVAKCEHGVSMVHEEGSHRNRGGEEVAAADFARM